MYKDSKLKKGFLYLICGLISLFFIFPFIWMISSSFKTTKAIFAETLKLIPSEVTFKAYESLKVLAGIPITHYIFNSFFIVIASMLLGVIVTSLSAYAIHRKPHLPGFKLMEIFFLASIMYPYILLMMPVYVIMYQLSLLGTYAGIVLFLCLGPIQYFLFREFFSKIPDELIESAQIDGGSEFLIFSRIVLPMARPVFLTVILLTFILNWENWFPVLIISTSMDTYTLPVALFTLDSQLGVNFPEIMALSCLISIPIIIIFIITQNKVIDGFAAGSVKG